MEVIEGGSPRRGSLVSLHRQSSGSFSKVNSPSSHHQLGNNSLCKDLDKFTKHFIIKTIQVIVQSRIGGNKRLKTECKPNGNDWFNININDIPEVSEQTKSALDFEGFTVRSNWRVCCEISLKTSDGTRVLLEHWILSNRSKLNSSLTKLNCNQGSQNGNHSTSRLSPLHHSSSNNCANPLGTIQTSTTRTRTYSQTPRTRLNSIDDCSGDSNYTTNKLLSGNNNENFDIKSSTSCYSLSSAAPNQTPEQACNNLISSPSTTSLSNNSTQQGQSTSSSNGTSSHGPNNKTAVSSIYTIYNRMSLLLKTLMTTTHIVPAYGIASRTSDSDPDSCTICYRVYACPPSYQNQKFSSPLSKGSLEDVSPNLNSDSTSNKRSPSNLSLGSLNTRDFVSPEELDQFCPILKLGSVKTEVNDLDVSLCYRTDVRNSAQFVSSKTKDRYNKLLDEDCIVAAKQLLACNDHLKHNNNHDDIDQNNVQNLCNKGALDYIDRPLRPAFAENDKNPEDPNLELVESAFDSLLQMNNQPIVDDPKQNGETCPAKPSNGSPIAQSEPIQVPKRINKPKNLDLYQNLSAGSTPKSLTDSFVFVDLNPPFASEEQNDINSFFHGPAPAFTNGFDALKDVDELTSQLAVIEANASQLDEFVDNICLSEDDEEEDHT